MSEYIDREALIEEIDAAENGEGMGSVVAHVLKRYLQRQPVAKVAAVREGAWINREHGMMVCSFCHTVEKQSRRARLHFCPNCGAKMDGGIDG